MKLKILFIALLMAGVTHANIIMTVDTDTEEFSFSGNDTLSTSQITLWRNAPLTEGAISCDGAFSFGGGGFESGTPIFQVSSSAISMSTEYINFGPDTIAGTGTTFSYASLTSGAKDYLEGLNGASISEVNGTGAGPLQINVIPEPAVSSLIVLMGGGFIVVRRIFTRFIAS